MMPPTRLVRRICKELGKNLPFTRLDELAHNALAKGLIDKDEAAILVKAEESRTARSDLMTIRKSWRRSR